MTVIWLIVVLVVVAVLFVTAESLRENRCIGVSEYTIHSDKVKKDIRFAVIADLHSAEFGENNSRLIQKIDGQKPAFIIVAGDLILGKPGQRPDVAVDLINKLADKYKVYIGKGNHELRTSNDTELYGSLWKDLYEGTKEKALWLINEDIYIPEYNVRIYGLDMDRIYYKRFKKTYMDDRYIKETIGPAGSENYDILIAHNPDYFPEYADWGADLSLSGHVHGGMMILPFLGGIVSPVIKLFPRYYKGLYSIGDRKMIVSAGLGCHTIKIRVFNKPDLVMVKINGKR